MHIDFTNITDKELLQLKLENSEWTTQKEKISYIQVCAEVMKRSNISPEKEEFFMERHLGYDSILTC